MAAPPSPNVSFLRIDQAYEAQIRKILEDAQRDIQRQILVANSKSLNPLTRIQLMNQSAAIKARLSQDWSDIGRAIEQGKLSAAAIAGKITLTLQSPLLRRILPADAVQFLAASEAERAANGLENVLARLSSSYKPLSSRVYLNTALSRGRVDAQINSALARGLTAKQFAAEMGAYISPSVAGGMPYAALRLARTEINNAFHATSVDRYLQNRTVRRVDWNLSRSHKHTDECDVLAAKTYDPTAVPEKPHPQCFCYITPALVSEADFASALTSGDFDDAPWWNEIMPTQPASLLLNSVVGLAAPIVFEYARAQIAAYLEEHPLERLPSQAKLERTPVLRR